MATPKPKSSAMTADGNVTVLYDDGSSKTLLAKDAQAKKLLPQDLAPQISGSGIGGSTSLDFAGAYGTNGSTAFTSAVAGTPSAIGVDPVSGQQIDMTNKIYWVNPKTGVKSTSDIGTELLAAKIPSNYKYIKAAVIAAFPSKKNSSPASIVSEWQNALIGAQVSKVDPWTWLKQMAGNDATTVTQPSTNISTRTYTPDAIRSIADQIFVSKLGRRVTDADLVDLTKQLNAKEKAQPTVTKSVPRGAGTVTQTTTSGGIDEQGIISQQAEKLPEYQRMQNLNFAGWLAKAMTAGPTASGGLANG
jgi:hypothetical protein